MKTHKLITAFTLLTVALTTQVSADDKQARKLVDALSQPSAKPDKQFDEMATTSRTQANNIDLLNEEYKSTQAQHERLKAFEKQTHSKFGGKANAGIRDARIAYGLTVDALKTQLQNVKTAHRTIDNSIKKAQTHLDKNKQEHEMKINDALNLIQAEPAAMPKTTLENESKK